MRIKKPEDEDYWKRYRATPKAYIRLDDGQKLWATRFGKLSSIRVDVPADADPEKFRTDLADKPVRQPTRSRPGRLRRPRHPWASFESGERVDRLRHAVPWPQPVRHHRRALAGRIAGPAQSRTARDRDRHPRRDWLDARRDPATARRRSGDPRPRRRRCRPGRSDGLCLADAAAARGAVARRQDAAVPDAARGAGQLRDRVRLRGRRRARDGAVGSTRLCEDVTATIASGRHLGDFPRLDGSGSDQSAGSRPAASRSQFRRWPPASIFPPARRRQARSSPAAS